MATEIKSDQIKSEKLVAIPSANKPTSPVEGMVFRADGSGDSAKGLYEYKNSKWVSLDNTFADMESIALLTSGDTSALQFAAALNSTSTAAGHKNAVPHETALGSISGTFTVPTTGSDALFTDRNANLVFRYASSGTASCKNEYVGITIDIPAAFRGQNLVAEFQYRTEESTTASSNNDFQLSVWDKTNGKSITSTDTSAKTAGQDIAVSSKTGLAVGDKIWLESGGNAVGDSANTITQSYITAISGTADTITISSDWTPASTTGSVLVTKFLSDYDIGLPEADSDTDKDGSTYKLAFKTEATTEQVNLYWQNKSTTANSLELFFDGILVSANKFLQASSQTQAEQGLWYGRGGTNGFGATYNGVLLPETEHYNTISKYGTAVLDDDDGFSFTANQRCRVNMTVSAQGDSTGIWVGISKNATGTELTTAIQSIPATKRVALNYQYAVTGSGQASFSGIVEKGDIIRPGASLVVVYNGSYDEGIIISMEVESDTSDVILLESQDEIFTDWVDWTPTFDAMGTVTLQGGQWRRVGGNMEIRAFWSSGTTTGGVVAMDLPSGYTIDSGKFNRLSDSTSASPVVGTAGQNAGAGRSFKVLVALTTSKSKLYFGGASTGSAIITPTTSIGNSASMSLFASVPISGWNSNFNPLLSLPLVEIGGNVETYQARNFDASTSANYRPVLRSTGVTDYNTINNLGVVDATDAYGWYFKATQRVKVTFQAGYQCSTAQAIFSIVKLPNAPSTYANNHVEDSQWVGLHATTLQVTEAANKSASVSAEVLMEPGEYLQVVTNNTNFANTDYVVFSMLVEKDFSNTNMAHIIKPAVAQARCELPQNTVGGQATSGSWQTRTVNKLEGESWYVSLDSNKLTFEPGTYEIQASAFFTNVGEVRVALWDETNSKILKYGQTGYNIGAYADAAQRWVSGLFTFTASTEVYIKYWTSSYNGTTDLGQPNNFTGVPEVYLNCIMRKLK